MSKIQTSEQLKLKIKNKIVNKFLVELRDNPFFNDGCSEEDKALNFLLGRFVINHFANSNYRMSEYVFFLSIDHPLVFLVEQIKPKLSQLQNLLEEELKSLIVKKNEGGEIRKKSAKGKSLY